MTGLSILRRVAIFTIGVGLPQILFHGHVLQLYIGLLAVVAGLFVLCVASLEGSKS